MSYNETERAELQRIDRALELLQERLRKAQGKAWMPAVSACTFLKGARLAIKLAIARLS